MTSPVKMLRTIRLDPSDAFVFDPPAAPGEWAVPGGFMFWDRDPAALTGRPRQAFRSGFLGLASQGWSTLVVVVEAAADERAEAEAQLARLLVERLGAPDMDTALETAREEIGFAIELARHPVQTLVALHRSVREDGSIAEQFRTLHTSADARAAAAMPCSAGAFAIVEDTEAADEGARGDAEADAGIDLAGMARARSGAP